MSEPRHPGQRAPRTGRLARAGVASGTLARLGAAQLLHGAQNLLPGAQDAAQRQAQEERLGRILFEGLNQLKGTALKAAQLLSLEVGLLPETLRAQLSRAHYQVTPLNRAHVHKLLVEEFGEPASQLFAHFEPQAFAAASLGQVHKARAHDGQWLAVKLQYPGMAAAVASDMALLRRVLGPVASAAGVGLPDAALVEQVLRDIESTVLLELDYVQEAQALQWFGQRLTREGLVVPQPRADLSSARVLSMALLEGEHLQPWLATGPSQAARDRVGQLLLESFWDSLLLGRIQADPHPGNYRVLSGPALGLLDFGRTLVLPAPFVHGLRRAWDAWLADSGAGVFEAYRALGLVGPGLALAQFRAEVLPALRPLMQWQMQPWRVARFDFATLGPPPPLDRALHQRAGQLLHAVPSELPFFDRAYLGLLQMLRELGARVDTGARWQALAAGAAPSPPIHKPDPSKENPP
ncbi:MAG: ABC1 kinase family protein [Rhodoferax sp.]